LPNLGYSFSAEVISNYEFTLSEPTTTAFTSSYRLAVQRSTNIEEACITHIYQKLHIVSAVELLGALEIPGYIDSMRATIANVDHDSGVVGDVANIGAELISGLCGGGL
jgi:hypothetical protein